jgi:glycosyltransferase involved in cell wall biosynthesis
MNANVVAGFAGRMAGRDTKVIVRESNAPVSTPKSTLSRWLTYKLAPLSYRLSHGVIAVSDGVAQELTRMDTAIKKRVHVVPTPVISEEVLALAEEPVDHPWFQNRKGPIIMSAARLERHKGFETLFGAFARLRDRVDARLLVLGEGSYRETLEAERDRLGLSDHIDMIGFQRNPFRFMAKADLFVLASEHEGLPNVLVQAMALGAPIVSTDCKAGPAEILCHGKFGRLVAVGDQESLSVAMYEALQEPRRTDAPEYARKKYGAAQATTEYLAIAGLA